MSMLNDIFGKKKTPFVEYSNLQFPNAVIICNTCLRCISYYAVSLDLINT